MKQLIVALAITLLSSLASSAPPPDAATRVAHMVAECRSVMDRGVCIVFNRDPMPEYMRRTPMRLGFGLGTVSTGAYIDIQLAGAGMCDLIAQSCTADWDGERCRVVRSLWRQQ